MHRFRHLHIFLVVLFLLNFVSGCALSIQKNTEQSQERTPPIPQEQTAQSDQSSKSDPATSMESHPQVINPLTGLSVLDPTRLERRPVMVKVGNFPREGRPHAGLSSADIVFDYYIGSGTNRFMALFYGEDAINIGPVRSGRRVDAELVTMYSGVLAYGSADEDTTAVLVSSLGDYALSHLEADCPVFCGDDDTHGAIGVSANSGAVSAHIDTLGLENSIPDLPGMVFDQQPPAGMKTAERLTILFNYYNRGEWRYDSTSGKYLRWIESVENEGEADEVMEMIPLTDSNTGEQLTFVNIILLFAKYTELAPSAHEIEIWGNNYGQPMVLFRDGVLVRGKWKTANNSDPLQFLDSDGKPLALKPGNTWIAIMDLNSSFGEVEADVWETFFFLP